jgi:hypothetical protein
MAAEETLEQKVNKEIESSIGKWVAGLVVPLALPISTIVSYYLQKWLGFKLSAGALSGYLGSVAAGVAISAYKWLENRGQWERSVLEIAKLYELGSGDTGPAKAK